MISLSKAKICIVGAGKYGSALAIVLQEKSENNITFLVRKEEQAKEINEKGTNSRVNEMIKFNSDVTATTDHKSALENADFILMSIKAGPIPNFFRKYKQFFNPKSVVVNCAKGMAIDEKKFLNEIYFEVFGTLDNYIVLSGPSFAFEMFKKWPTMVTIAGNDKKSLTELSHRFKTRFFTAYVQYDIMGTEIVGCLKNLFAIGAGMIDGLGYGYNSLTALTTRGVKEIQLICLEYKADPQSMIGMSGVGDLMLTCFGKLSRNRTTGYRLAKGESLDQIVKEIGTVEGLPTLRVMIEKIKESENFKNFKIIRAVYDVIYGGAPMNRFLDMIFDDNDVDEFKGVVDSKC